MSEPPAGPPMIGALLRTPVDEIHRRIIAGLHDQGYTDIVPAHLPVLRWPGPVGQRPVDLAAETGMSKQAMNYLLGQIEGLGYLERRADADDPRSKRVYLTERGKAIRDVVRATVRQVEKEWAQHLGKDDFEQLRALLVRLQPVVRNNAAS